MGRELLEPLVKWSTGTTPLGSFYTSPGFADEVIHAFLAEDLKDVGQALEPGEDIQLELLLPDDALAMIADGRIKDAKTICVLLMWDRSRPRDVR